MWYIGLMIAPPIEIQMTAHQIAVARMHLLYFRPLLKLTSWLIFAGVLAISTWWSWMVDGPGVPGRWLAGFFALVGSWLLLNYSRERGRKEVARMYREGFSLTLREDGLLYQVGESFEVLPWAKFNRGLLTRHWYYLFFDSTWALIIPRRSFETVDDYRHWAALASARIPAQVPVKTGQ